MKMGPLIWFGYKNMFSSFFTVVADDKKLYGSNLPTTVERLQKLNIILFSVRFSSIWNENPHICMLGQQSTNYQPVVSYRSLFPCFCSQVCVAMFRFQVFLNHARLKFVGFTAPDDIVSLAGLPQPIHEAVFTMREHLYVSLGEVQMQREATIARYPLSMVGEPSKCH